MGTLKFKKTKFGTLYNGKDVHLFTVSNGKMSVSFSDYGCTITSIVLPAKNGKEIDVVLGCSTLEGFASDNLSFGTVVGRFANRIGDAKFKLDGKEYKLDNNDSGNCLHGGFDRYEKKVWTARKILTPKGIGVELSLIHI